MEGGGEVADIFMGGTKAGRWGRRVKHGGDGPHYHEGNEARGSSCGGVMGISVVCKDYGRLGS